MLGLVELPAEGAAPDPAPPMPTTVAIRDGIAWVGTYPSNGALHGYDVREPRWPREVVRTSVAGAYATLDVRTLAVEGTRAFAGYAWDTSVAMLYRVVEWDVSQPRNVVTTSRLGAR